MYPHDHLHTYLTPTTHPRRPTEVAVHTSCERTFTCWHSQKDSDLTWPAIILTSHGAHFLLCVRARLGTYRCQVYKIGASSYDVELSVKGRGRHLSYHLPLEDVVQSRRRLGEDIDGLSVGRELAHWMSGTFGADSDQKVLRLGVRITHPIGSYFGPAGAAPGIASGAASS